MTDNYTPRTSGFFPRIFYGYIVVAASFIIMMLAWGLYVVFGVFFDPLVSEFGWTHAVTSGAYSLSSVLHGVIAIAIGGIVDKYGPRIVVTVSGVILGAGYLLMSQVNSVWQFYLFYGVIIGIGMSGFWIPLISPISRWFVARRSLMTGIVICGLTLGQLIAPVIIGRLIEAYDWRLAYIIIGAVVLAVITVFAQFLKRDPGRVGRLPYGAENGRPEMAAVDASGYSLKEAFGTYQFWLGFLILFCFGYSAFSITVHLVPHAIDLDISRVTASDMLAVNGGVGIIGNFLIGGLLADIIGNRKAFIIGFTIATVSLVWLIYTGEMWTLFLFAAVFGISMGSIGTSESPLIARLFGLKNHGLIYGVLGMGFTVGGAIGPFVTGYIYDIVKSYDDAFWVSVGFAALGLILTIALKPTPKMQTAL